MDRNTTTIKAEVPAAEELARLAAPQARAFDFPDGIRRIVTLPAKYWADLARMEAIYGKAITTDLLAAALDGAREWSGISGDTVEAELRIAMRLLVKTLCQNHALATLPVANRV